MKKVYIGQSWDLNGRFSYYNRGRAVRQQLLNRSLVKYGVKNHIFEVIHELPSDVSQEVLDNYEIFYCNQYKSLSFNMLNIKEPGRGGKHTPETKKLMSERQKETHKQNPNRLSTHWKKVYQYTLEGDFIKEFKSIMEAVRETGIRQSCISNCTAGRTKFAGRYLWRYNR